MIHVPDAVRSAMMASEAKFVREIACGDLETAVDKLIALTQDGAYTFLRPFLQPQYRVLEIGSGNGLGLCGLLARGVNATGVEPGNTVSFEGRYHRACELLRANGHDPDKHLVPATGESLPFPDASFDVVFSIAVLEHVKDVPAVLREALRVVKPGGLVLMNVPTYWSWYEGHYNTVWCPLLAWSKPAARWYVRTILRRPDYYVDEMNFLTRSRVRQMVPAAIIYPFAMPPFARISALWFALSEGRPVHPITKWLREHPVCEHPVRWVAGALSHMSAVAGIATVLNVVIRKRMV